MSQATRESRRLHVGGQVRTAGWEVLDANPGAHVDHVCNANTLTQFADGTFSDIYASHVVEHLDYDSELANTLREWHRVLEPGGRVFISVPDMEILASLFLEKERLSLEDRFMVMRMMFGGHVDKYDYHVVGLNLEFLDSYLRGAGFVNIRRVDNFGLFDDTSTLVFADVPISLNVIAEKSHLTSMGDGGTNSELARNRPCPCGSGKRYKHCHGAESAHS